MRGAGTKELRPHPRTDFGSFQSNHEFTFRVREPMAGARFEVAALPVVTLEPSAIPEAPPSELPEAPAEDVEVYRSTSVYRLSLRGFAMGFVQVRGSTPLAVGAHAEGGAVGWCGQRGVVALAYEGVRKVGGEVELVWARGFFDRASCRAAVVERHAVRLQQLGRFVYAFRARCPGCGEEARDVLHVITPQTALHFDVWTPFEHHTLALGPGRSGAIDASIEPKSGSNLLPDWDDVLGGLCTKGSFLFCTQHVRVEVSQGRGEPEPTLFVSLRI